MFIDTHDLPQYRMQITRYNDFRNASDDIIDAIPCVYPPKYHRYVDGTQYFLVRRRDDGYLMAVFVYEIESSETLKDGKILESLLTWESTSGKQANEIGRTREDSGYTTYPSWTISPTPMIGSITDWTTTYTTCPMHEELSCSSTIFRSVSTTGETSELINGATTPKNSPLPLEDMLTLPWEIIVPQEDQEIYPTMPPVQVPEWEDPTITTTMNPDLEDSTVTSKASLSTNDQSSTSTNSNQFLYLELMMEEMKMMMNTSGELELTLPMEVADGEQQQQHPAMVDSAVLSFENLPTEECQYGATMTSDIEESTRDMSTPTMEEYSSQKKLGTPNQDHLNKPLGMSPDIIQMRSTTSTPESLPQISTTPMSNGTSEGMDVVEGEEEELIKRKEKRRRKNNNVNRWEEYKGKDKEWEKKVRRTEAEFGSIRGLKRQMNEDRANLQGKGYNRTLAYAWGKAIYEKPHVSSMAYRIFGSPTRLLALKTYLLYQGCEEDIETDYLSQDKVRKMSHDQLKKENS
ncbi:5735_t:CDS:2 [Paraglomus brasilianum]|uniref:5735_t:CDS:1 n=1 Tax=Paraglomus brasilianum TaxID=144538 RepID=A0A9N9DVD8_9GLOM|nr:5735_t:CDS:2 [Paraglomus brasilianum]